MNLVEQKNLGSFSNFRENISPRYFEIILDPLLKLRLRKKTKQANKMAVDYFNGKKFSFLWKIQTFCNFVSAFRLQKRSGDCFSFFVQTLI